MSQKNKPQKTIQKSASVSWKTVFGGVIIAAIIVVIGGGVAKYAFGFSSDWFKKMESIIPYPAALIDYSRVITAGEFNENISSIRQFYEAQDFSKVGLRIDFSTNEGKKRLKIKEKEILNKMIEDRIIIILAQRQGIKITDEMVNQALDRKLQEYGTEKSVRDNLFRLYGWTIMDFKEKIVKPDLYRDELEKIFENNDNAKEKAREIIEEARKELANGGEFAQVAKKYSQGMSAAEGGELGWFDKKQLMPEIAESIMNLSKGERSGILKSKAGYHIIEINDKKNDQEKEMVNIRQIFVSSGTFSDWLEKQMKQFTVIIPLKDFFWNKKTPGVDFQSGQFKDFENKIKEQFHGDASIMF